MILIHKGVRPLGTVELSDFKRKLYIEVSEEGSYKIWTKKMLNSGCGGITKSSDNEELLGCIYCPYCDEYFSKNQWESYGVVTSN